MGKNLRFSPIKSMGGVWGRLIANGFDDMGNKYHNSRISGRGCLRPEQSLYFGQ